MFFFGSLHESRVLGFRFQGLGIFLTEATLGSRELCPSSDGLGLKALRVGAFWGLGFRV